MYQHQRGHERLAASAGRYCDCEGVEEPGGGGGERRAFAHASESQHAADEPAGEQIAARKQYLRVQDLGFRV